MKAWLVNTNSKLENEGSHCFEYMLRHNKAAAYHDTWNTQIDPIEKGDLILLYHNNNKIIAVGFVVKAFESHDYQETMGDVEHWVDVNWLWKVSFDNQLNPINPIMRTDELNIPVVLRTVINITEHINYRLLLEEVAKRQIYL